MNSVENIVHQTRGTGNTTWLLKAAINDPDCIIIARNGENKNDLYDHYHWLLGKERWYRRLWWRVFGRKHPEFRTLRYSFNGVREPVIFDNSSLINLSQ